MKIHFTIEFDKDEMPRLSVRKSDGKGKPTQLLAVPELNGGGVLHISPSAAIAAIKKPTAKFVKIADLAPPPILREEEPEPARVRVGNAGNKFDPGFLAIVRDAKEPMTRVQIAVATGLSKEDVTMKFNRMKHKGWLEQPAPGLWRKTKNFAQTTNQTGELND